MHSMNPTSSAQITFEDESSLRTSLRNFELGEIGLREIGDEGDFFVAGLDSLQVANSARLIKRCGPKSRTSEIWFVNKGHLCQPKYCSTNIEDYIIDQMS